MNSLQDQRFTQLLASLHQQAEASDSEHFEDMMARIEAPGASMAAIVADLLAEERSDYRAVYHRYAGNFLSVTPGYGRFLYAIARAMKAKRIVEFGTSMGVSTLYLAAALRDNGGGHLIGTEFEPGKVARARENLAAAGLADLVDIREGDARETLKEIEGEVDFLLVDGAFSLYLTVLKLAEPMLRSGAVALGENAFDPAYLDYIRNPANGYLSQTLPIDEGRGNEFTVRIG